MEKFENCGITIYEKNEIEVIVFNYEGVSSIGIFAPEGCFTFNDFESEISLLKEYFTEFEISDEEQNEIIEKAITLAHSPSTFFNFDTTDIECVMEEIAFMIYKNNGIKVIVYFDDNRPAITISTPNETLSFAYTETEIPSIMEHFSRLEITEEEQNRILKLAPAFFESPVEFYESPDKFFK